MATEICNMLAIVFFEYIINQKVTRQILITLLTKYSTIIQIQYHEEQDVMSTPWLEGGEKRKQRFMGVYVT